MKPLRYAVEAFALSFAFLIFRLMPVVCASALGGFLARTIGPRLAVSRKASRHIEMALETAPEDTKSILKEMWDNLGRTFAEYPHLKNLSYADRTEIIGVDHLENIKIDSHAIMFSGHLGNWEILGPSYVRQFYKPIGLIFREPNNPASAWLLNKCRTINDLIALYPKSLQGMRNTVAAIKDGQTLGILIDQKYNEGIALPFFGKPAMTSPAFVQLAQKFDLPLIPIQVERIKGPTFRVTVHKPIPTKGRSIEDVIKDAHTHLESWIKQNPGQWLWLHRRWVED